MKLFSRFPESPTRPDLHSSRRAFEIQARFARTMGHPIRQEILHHLHQAGSEVGVAELLRLLDIPKAALSQHLTKMLGVGLIQSRREGRYVFVRLAHPEIAKACEAVRTILVDQARDQEEALESNCSSPPGARDSAPSTA